MLQFTARTARHLADEAHGRWRLAIGSACLTAVIIMARVLADGDQPILTLLVIPLALMAMALGWPYGLLLAVAAEAGVMIADSRLDLGMDGYDYFIRGVIFVFVGLVFGWLADSLRALRAMASRDMLTGVLTKAAFEWELNQHAVRCQRYGGMGALLFIDVDDFKSVNDTHGHGAGDRALRQVGQAIKGRVRRSDVVGRVGGDEFAVLMPVGDAQDAGLVADNLLAAIKGQDWRFLDRPLTASVGISTFDSHLDPHLVAETADRAMYGAKRGGGDRASLAARARRGTP